MITRLLVSRFRCVTTFLALSVIIAGAGCAAFSGQGTTAKTTVAPGIPTSASALSTPERLTLLAEQATGKLLQHLQAVYRQSDKTAQITGTVSGNVPRTSAQISASQERVKLLCFQIQRALWTSNVPLREVTVTILGLVLDDYYDQITSWYGTADLTATAALQLDWHDLNADAAWMRFDNTLLRVNYASFQLYGRTPAPTPSNP